MQKVTSQKRLKDSSWKGLTVDDIEFREGKGGVRLYH